jgi:hypothetical protein
MTEVQSRRIISVVLIMWMAGKQRRANQRIASGVGGGGSGRNRCPTAVWVHGFCSESWLPHRHNLRVAMRRTRKLTPWSRWKITLPWWHFRLKYLLTVFFRVRNGLHLFRSYTFVFFIRYSFWNFRFKITPVTSSKRCNYIWEIIESLYLRITIKTLTTFTVCN